MEKRNRGRPPRHPELTALQKWAHNYLHFVDVDGNQEEIYTLVREGSLVKGCNFSHYAKAQEDAWVVKFSFAGQQYTIATLKLYDACSLYDCLLVWFEEYRRQRPGADVEHPDARFNFGRAIAESHIETNEDLKNFLTDLEKFFRSLGVLITAEERAVARAEKETVRQTRYSLRGMLNQNVADILDELDQLKRGQAEMLQLIKLLSHT